MKQLIVACTLLFFTITGTFAQTKVFKEVGNEMSSSMRTISQDGTLVGYLVFTELEKADKDSFNYKITIMDENLNDIGVVNFREMKLDLRSVAFEQEVLCLSYMKSNLLGHAIKKRKEIREAVSKGYMAVFTQFIDLTGKVLKTNTIKVGVDLATEYRKGQLDIGNGGLKEPLRVSNIAGKGFACFFGDDRGKFLYIYDIKGNQTWQKKIGGEEGDYNMLVSGHDVYFLLQKKDEKHGGGFYVFGYGLEDSTSIPKYYLKDKKGNPLQVQAFSNDPVSGKPFVSGKIINPRRNRALVTYKSIAKGNYLGLFTVNIDGRKKDSIKHVYNYWNDVKNPIANSKGRLHANKSYLLAGPSFKDYSGNTYFTGSALKRRMNVGLVAAEVATVPLVIVSPIMLGYFGTRKFTIRDAMVIKQTPDGALSVDNTIPVLPSRGMPCNYSLLLADNKSYYTVSSSDTKSTYLIITDQKNINFYSVDQKKVLRTISRKDGNLETYIFPAKEGHVMVSEYNKKEKTRRFSIEAI
ncbi:DUF6770 family protein [Chitinophaga arvensicola]|uniref:Uncharacterized protein n=1 Tax=Chitinophaga arvensicola TaxID=29529 RepID=A0A1I0RP57_9BACT|nr:DUF6770 family protein [Chitinophaga arvensicola]SEW42847.1 hypothetical protein SAMN04488122_3148 [Chitinophaga arvensicola]